MITVMGNVLFSDDKIEIDGLIVEVDPNNPDDLTSRLHAILIELIDDMDKNRTTDVDPPVNNRRYLAYRPIATG